MAIELQNFFPSRINGLLEVPVANELVIFKPLDDSADQAGSALTLNWSGREIWKRCDGRSTAERIALDLSQQFDIRYDRILLDVRSTLMELSQFGALEGLQTSQIDGVTFSVGIEDTPYFWWQLAILAQSLEYGCLIENYSLHVVVCNDFAPLSAELMKILSTYSLSYSEAHNHAVSTRIDIGLGDGKGYAALNRIEALKGAAAHGKLCRLICLLDSDTFLYGSIQRDMLPATNSLAFNRHVEIAPFFTSEQRNQSKGGVDLQKLLSVIGCQTPLVTGAVIVAIERELAQNEKFIADCFRFAEAVYLLAKAAGVEDPWIAEMPCFAMALANAGIIPELLTDQRVLVPEDDACDIPTGSFYHYYSDPADFGVGGFAGSTWSKQMFRDRDLLRTDLSGFAEAASTDHEKYFFHLAQTAARRVYG